MFRPRLLFRNCPRLNSARTSSRRYFPIRSLAVLRGSSGWETRGNVHVYGDLLFYFFRPVPTRIACIFSRECQACIRIRGQPMGVHGFAPLAALLTRFKYALRAFLMARSDGSSPGEVPSSNRCISARNGGSRAARSAILFTALGTPRTAASLPEWSPTADTIIMALRASGVKCVTWWQPA